MLAASVAAVPPLVLLASTHLTVVLVRSRPADSASEPEAVAGVPDRGASEPVGRRRTAARLREEGWSNKAIARHLKVAPSTVGRWFAATPTVPDVQENPKDLTP